MSAVIKQGAGAEPGHIRTLGGAMGMLTRPRGPSPLDLAEAEIHRLQALVEALTGDLVDAKRAALERFEEGRAEGRLEGEAAAEVDHGKALTRLEAGIALAADLHAEQFGALERLAPAIARAGLQRLLGDAPEFEALVVQTIREHLSRLEDSAILSVEVSSQDFSSDDALSALSAAVAAPKAKIEARGDLAAGECRFRLTLGALEVGPSQQWRNLDRLLQDLASGGGG